MSIPFDTRQYLISSEPFYQPQNDEIELYQAAYAARRMPYGAGATVNLFSEIYDENQ